MEEIPSDIKLALGQLFVLASVTSDPGLLLRITRSFMSLTLACMAKLNGGIPEGKGQIEEWEEHITKIEHITAEYGENGGIWPNVLNQCGRTADYFYAIGVLNDFIEIDDSDFNLTLANTNPKGGNNDNGSPDAKYLHS
ncbi:MAG: hypothetical protein M0R03_19770 [Novosphingobium sp.]|nr:hypothetical protein [Novosphingobium sp.]